MRYMTPDELEALQCTKLDKAAPYAIPGVTHSQFSVARHYGMCRLNGFRYIYIEEFDELVRDDVLDWLTQRRKAAARAQAGAVVRPKQCELL